MREEQQVETLWGRLERWLGANLPQALAGLPRPASERAIAAAERQTGLSFPPALRASYLRHDGAGAPGVFPDGQRLLAIGELVERWSTWRQQLGQAPQPAPQGSAEALVEQTVVQGPVRPLGASARWLPLMEHDGATSRYLDFDPPAGGARGQLIAVDLGARSWRALAPSFLAFLDHFVDGLEGGRYVVVEGQVRTRHDEQPQLGGEWDMPDFLGRRAQDNRER